MADPVQVQCFTCSRFSFPKEKPEWIGLGFGNCADQEIFIMYGARRLRDCVRHLKADSETVAKRDGWLKGKSL